MISVCENTVAATMPIGFPAFAPCRLSEESLVTPRPASAVLSGGERTVCGACGTVHRTFYDHKVHLVRDLSCGRVALTGGAC